MVLLAPLVHPVNVVLVVPVYVISSFTMCIVPEESNPDVLATVIVVTLSVCVVLVVVVTMSSSCSTLLAMYSLYDNVLKFAPDVPKVEFLTILAVL